MMESDRLWAEPGTAANGLDEITTGAIEAVQTQNWTEAGAAMADVQGQAADLHRLVFRRMAT
jgi:hypothetical protein